MNMPANRVYEFGPYRLDTVERVLLRAGQPVPLTLKAFDVLRLLVENSGHIVEKDELMNRVWAGSFVEEGNLKVTVSMVRKALEDTHNGNRYVETVPRRGYRFVAKVREITDETVDLVIHERRRETLTIDEVGVASESNAASSYPIDGRLSQKVRPRKLGLALAAVLLLSGSAAAIFLGIKYFRPGFFAKRTTAPFSDFKITALTTSGRNGDAAISPDGKYVVYATGDRVKRSLSMKHIATGSDTAIAGAEGQLGWVTFSPNGNDLYYVAEDGNTLYQMPILGGTPRKLTSDVDSAITFSPDGRQLAFLRGYPTQLQACVVVANSDGTGERKLASHRIGELFLNGAFDLGPAWSPDGKSIVFASRKDPTGASDAGLMAVQVNDGAEKLIASGPWQTIGHINWLRDGSGLVFVAAEPGPEAIGQIWHVSYPGGEVSRITHDLLNYQGVSLSADSQALVTVQSQRISDLWTTPNESDDPVHISSGRYDGLEGLAWTPDGRVVYVSRANGQYQIWITNADGTGKKQLTFDNSWKGKLSVSPDGRYLVFASSQANLSHIWRMDIDGGGRAQLSRGQYNGAPQITFDSRWVVYNSFDGEISTIWKVPITGGEPVRLITSQSAMLAMSPRDGQILYDFVEQDERSNPRRRFAVMPFEGGTARTLNFVLPGRVMKWAPDGQALTYAQSREGVSNIWSQPLDGGAPKQLTNFKSHVIFRHDWSLDGKRLVLARGTYTSDVVLIKNLAGSR